MNEERSIARDLADGLREFADRLKAGEPIEATRVTRYDTPDGPMHVREKVMLEAKDET
jgi:hypothetical protein